ncbi:MAG: hypothetical protein V2A73_06985 [Pseudomonadota bacterium]
MLRPQDLALALRVALNGGPRLTLEELAAALSISVSEAHAAVKRATAAGLLRPDRQANRTALVEFIVHGMKYVFMPRRGPLTRGMPTAHGAPPLDTLVGSTAEPPPVWPDADGTVRGESFEPLYRSVPKAAKKDPQLYQALCLVDAIRGGRARDRAIAEKLIKEMLNA